MVITCWSAKGGAGTTVVATAIALSLTRPQRGREPIRLFPRQPDHSVVGSPPGALLVDLAGEAPAVLGLPEPAGPGVADWLAATSDVPPDGLARLEVEVGEGLHVVPRGGSLPSEAEAVARAEVLAAVLAADTRVVVVDCGCLAPQAAPDGAERPAGAAAPVVPAALAASGSIGILVTRTCYLALRRAAALPLRPTGVVVIEEPGRALHAADVEAVIDRPILATIPWDPAVGRAVDGGLFGSRMPRALSRALVRAS